MSTRERLSERAEISDDVRTDIVPGEKNVSALLKTKEIAFIQLSGIYIYMNSKRSVASKTAVSYLISGVHTRE